MLKKIKYILAACFLITCASAVAACASENKNPQPVKPIATVKSVEVIKTPTAECLVIGQSTDESGLTGEFSVEGELKYTDEAVIAVSAGKIVREWVFEPEDVEEYEELAGSVQIEVYENKITFEENGGFEIEDVYFNESYTLKNKPLTAKNAYRFEGWTTEDGGEDYIDYPTIFTSSATLYAGYRFHTEDKIHYFIYEDGDCGAEASWEKYWRLRGNEEEAKKNTNPGYRITDPPIEGSIEGEVVMADMYEGKFVTCAFFDHTKISSIVFSNYTYYIDLSTTLIKDLRIPNTVKYIDTFFYSENLETLVLEGGESATEWDNENREMIFEYKVRIAERCPNVMHCPKLKTVEFNNVKIMGAFVDCDFESIVIPASVEVLKECAFSYCPNLKDVIFEEGSRLKEVGDRAFNNCVSLKSISLPAQARVSAYAFRGCENLEEIDITDEQIQWMAYDLHERLIDKRYYSEDLDSKVSVPNDFKVNITRGSEYSGVNAQGVYTAGTECIDLYFDKFDIYAVAALSHEFFHHYQYVLCYGNGNENWDSVPDYDVYMAWNSGPLLRPYPVIVLKKNDWEYNIRTNDGDVYLIDEDKINEWKQPYIELKEDDSNYEEYWNQPFEADARMFAYWCTGFEYV